MKNQLSIYLVSDSVGETAQKVLAAATAQFPEVDLTDVHRYPFVKDKNLLKDILRDATQDSAVVITTLVNQELVEVVQDYVKKTGLSVVDYMTPMLSVIKDKTGQQPLQKAGALHQLNQDYYSRVEAIEFAVRYDDGKDPRGFLEADYVLIGVSRTSKTPLSMYLANKKHKVANLPLIPEVPLPKELYEVPKEKIIGLTTSVETLMGIRKSRLSALGLKDGSNYTNMERILGELEFADKLFKELGCKVVNVEDRAIEETAILIESSRNS